MKSMLFQLMVWVLLGVVIKPVLKPIESDKTSYRVYFFLSEGCPMCQGYAGTLHDLALEYGSKGVTFIGVFPNYYATDTAIIAFKKKYDIPFKLQRDPGFRLTNQFNAQITPQVFLTDEKNVVLYSGMIDNAYYKAGKRRGVTSDFYLKKALDNVLNHQAVEFKETKPIGCVIVRN